MEPAIKGGMALYDKGTEPLFNSLILYAPKDLSNLNLFFSRTMTMVIVPGNLPYSHRIDYFSNPCLAISFTMI